jgi:iron complex transport system ATP-binding protein
VWVTHHPGEIPPEIDRVILLKHGRLFAGGPRRKILTSKVLGRLYDMKLKVRWSGAWCDVRFE